MPTISGWHDAMIMVSKGEHQNFSLLAYELETQVAYHESFKRTFPSTQEEHFPESLVSKAK